MTTYTYTCPLCTIVAQAENPTIAANLINRELTGSGIHVRIDPSDLKPLKHELVRIFKHR